MLRAVRTIFWALGALAAGAGAESILTRRERDRVPRPGDMIPVGRHRLHALCAGTGEVACVLEAGEGEWSAHWSSVIPLLSEHVRVIAYDRAGLGWSEPGPGPRTGAQMAAELSMLLDTVHPRGPVILVGHAFGGFVMRHMAARLADRVRGVVFVDACFEHFDKQLEAAGVALPALSPWELRLFRSLSALGAVRAAGWVLARLGERTAYTLGLAPDNENEWQRLPPPLAQAISLLGRQPRVLAAMQDELAGRRATEAEMAALPGIIAAPVRMLVAEDTVGVDSFATDTTREIYNRMWIEHALATCPRSKDFAYSLVSSDHAIMLRQPERVAAAVLELLA